MKAAKVVFRNATLTALTLAATVNIYAGAAPKPVAPDQPRYSDELAKIKEEKIDADIDYKNATLRCRGKSGCQAGADKAFAEAQKKIRIHEIDNNTEHSAEIVMETRRQQRAKITGKDTAELTENLRHFDADTSFDVQDVYALDKYEKAKINCADRACLVTAEHTKQTDLDRIEMQVNTEEGNHEKKIIEIERSRKTK